MQQQHLVEALAETQSADNAVRRLAEERLAQIVASDFAAFVDGIGKVIHGAQYPVPARQAAIFCLKNELFSRNAARKRWLSARWLSLDANLVVGLRRSALSLLISTSDDTVVLWAALAQLLAAIALIEGPLAAGKWSSLVQDIEGAVQTALVLQPPARAVAATKALLDALRIFLEESTSDAPLPQASQESLLRILVAGLRVPEERVQRAALQLVSAAVAFLRDRLASAGHALVSMIASLAASQSTDVAILAYEAIVHFVRVSPAGLFPSLVQVVARGFQEGREQVLFLCIEFWSSICEVELASGGPSSESLVGLQILRELLPLLLNLLVAKDNGEDADDDEEDEWTVQMASATCLGLLAARLGDAVLLDRIVLAFVEANVADASSWARREAALLAFGSILEGPSPQLLGSLMHAIWPVLVDQRLRDPDARVRDTAAWVAGRLAESLVEQMSLSERRGLLQALVALLADAPRVARNATWSAMNVVVQLGDAGDAVAANACDPALFAQIISACIRNATAASSQKLTMATLEALSNMIRYAAVDCVGVVRELHGSVVEGLKSAVSSGSLGALHVGMLNVEQACVAKIAACAPQMLSSPDADLAVFLRVIDIACAGESELNEALLKEASLTVETLIPQVSKEATASTSAFCMQRMPSSHAAYESLAVILGSAIRTGAFIRGSLDAILGILAGHISRCRARGDFEAVRVDVDLLADTAQSLADEGHAIREYALAMLMLLGDLLRDLAHIFTPATHNNAAFDFGLGEAERPLVELRRSVFTAISSIVQAVDANDAGVVESIGHQFLPPLFAIIGPMMTTLEPQRVSPSDARSFVELLGDVLAAFAGFVSAEDRKWMRHALTHTIRPKLLEGAEDGTFDAQVERDMMQTLQWLLSQLR